MSDKVRIDQWLWAVRIFKSRSLANTACKSGKVKRDGKSLKPSTPVEINDQLFVLKNGYNYVFKVRQLLKKRVGAKLAVEAYFNETPEEELRKYDSWFIGKARAEVRERGSGRPTKKERREIDGFKGDGVVWHTDSDMDIE